MERSVVAFAPGHISGYFRRFDGPTTERTGSLGAGIVIDRGVTVTLKPSAVCTAKVASGEHPHLLLDAAKELGISADITAQADMPIGAGFGMSAAALLATAYAANRLFDLGMSETELAQFAHAFEVKHGTGLGDVAASAGGGIDVRTEAGIHGVTARIRDSRKITAVTLGPISTPEIITSPSTMQQVTAAFPVHVPETLDEVMANSRSFAENSGLITPRVRTILDACDHAGITASMTMLGEGVFAVGPAAEEVLSRFGTAYTFSAAETGPAIIREVR